MGPAYHKVVQAYFRYAEYDDCFLYCKRLNKVKDCTVPREEYYTEFALTLYYLDDYGEMTRFHKLTLEKSFMEQNVDYCIIKDIKALHINPKITSAFKTMFEYKFDVQQIMKNIVMSQQDFGFLYSLISLAFRTREELLTEVSWSGDLQQLYHRRQYKRILEIIDRQKVTKCYLSIFEQIYSLCQNEIRVRIFSDIIQSFDRCPFTLL